MSRVINCRGCGYRHTGAGGSRCKFLQKPKDSKDTMASVDLDVPSRDSPEYKDYLEKRILEQESLLRKAEENVKTTMLEQKLASLRLQTERLADETTGDDSGNDQDAGNTGFTGRILSGRHEGHRSTLQTPPASPEQTKTEKEIISKLRPCSYVTDFKSTEKTTYREFIMGMTKVLQFVIEVSGVAKGYASHMSFIADKASLNLYATDALIKYEMAVSDKVISGDLQDWVSADPESVAMHLGADATYAVRGANRPGWCRGFSGNSGNSGNTRDFSDWPREVCWLYINTTCYFQRCRRAHICAKCRKSGHPQKECDTKENSSSPSGDKRRPKRDHEKVRDPRWRRRTKCQHNSE